MSFDVVAVFMPIYEVGTGRVHGYEAFARGLDGKHFAELYASAECEGTVAELDRRCLRAAFRHASSLMDDCHLFVNVLPHSLPADRILFELEQVCLKPEQVVFEIVPFIAGRRESQAAFSALATAGCQFALDGFGTGYSSLTRLTTQPFQYLKMARDFIDDPILLESARGLAESTGLEFVATGVESPSQLATAVSAGADYVQGSYLSEPLPRPQGARLSSSVAPRLGA